MRKIGFAADGNKHISHNDVIYQTMHANKMAEPPQPVKSIVQVYFPPRNMTLTYYNDAFDLKAGDLVYVEGKLEGVLGCVKTVNYNFKIKVSDYMKVIDVVDTSVHGTLYLAGSHLAAFDRDVIPYEKIVKWFLPPGEDDDEFVSNSDDTSFSLHDLGEMIVEPKTAERGHKYYLENRVCYLSIDSDHGRAIVEGSSPYEVEFIFDNGQISQLICTCPFGATCKHEFAAMLQLQETLDIIQNHIPYADEFERTGYFAAISRNTLLRFGNSNQKTGSITLGEF